MEEKRRNCITSFSTRFKVNDIVMYCRDGAAKCKYGIIVDIVDLNPYSYTYKIKWLGKDDFLTEELDGVWLAVVE